MKGAPRRAGAGTRRPSNGSPSGGSESVAGSPGSDAARPIALALARTHLRLGNLALARVELEVLGAQGELDLAGQVDLAEARWRLGDLTAAAAAAAVAIDAGEEDPVALTIAAEAAAAAGRPNEARRLASRALERLDRPLEAIFAGMPRSAVWPDAPDEPPPTATSLFAPEPVAFPTLRAGETDPSVVASRAAPAAEPTRTGAATEGMHGFWDTDAAIATPVEAPGALPDAADELEAARAARVAGADDEAILRFGLVLRLSPALAPAVLEATQGLSGPAASLVRGDAFRLVGMEAEAQRAFAAAAWSGTRDRRATPASEGPSAPTGATAPPPRS